MSRKDIPSESASNFSARLRETVQTMLGTRGDKLDRVVTLRDLIESGITKLGPGATVGSGTVPLLPGPSIPEPEVYEQDLTPPPTPEGFAVDAAISHVLLSHDAPIYTQGHGHLRTRLYGVTVLPADPLPTFSDAVEITQFSGTVHAHPSNPSTTWRLWIKWESVDGVLSATPAGGTNGLEARTGEDVALLLDALAGQITSSELATSLATPIALIGQPTTGIVARLDAQTTIIGSIQTELATLSGTPEYASGVTYDTDDIVQYDGGLYRALSTTTGNLPTSTTYWQKIGDYASLGDAVAAHAVQLEDHETRIVATEDGLVAEASARTLLASTVASNSAAISSEASTRATADSALSSTISTVSAVANSKIKTYNQPAAPTTGMTAGDLWFDSDDSNRAYRYSGSSWVETTDTRIASTVAAVTAETSARVAGDSALANQVTTIQARLVTRPNMLPNGGFESGLTGWTPTGALQDKWASSDGAWGSVAVMAAPSGTSFNGVGTLSSDWIEVDGGVPYTVHGDATLFGAAGSSVYFDLIFRDASNNIVLDGGQNSKGPSFNFSADDTNRPLFAVTAMAPANAVRAQARFVFTAVNATTIGCRMIKVERGALPYTPYTSEQASVALGAAIQEERSARITAIEAEALARESLEAAVDSNTAAISTEAAARATADSALSTQVATLQAEVDDNAAAISTEASARATADAANATQITTVQSRLNRVVNYRIQSRGGSSTIGATGFFDEAGVSLYGGTRSYTLVVLNGSTGAVISRTTYDVFGVGTGTGGGTATTMAAALNALANDKVVVIYTFDEPQNNRLSGGLPEAMYRCGASRAVFGSSAFKYRSAYILVGIPGIGEGMGVERYVGAVDSDTTAYVDYQLQLINGRPVALGGSPTAAAIQIESATRATQTGDLFAKYTVKVDVAGLVSGYGLASSANNAAPTSSFGVRASNFYVAPPSVASATAPTSNLYKGFVWLDTSVTPSVTRYYTGSAWSTTPQALPFVIQTAPTTINGLAVPAGVYIEGVFIRNATITSAQIVSVKADSIQSGFLSAVTSHTGAIYNGVNAYTLTTNADTGMVTATATGHAPGTVNFGTGYYLANNQMFVGSPTTHMHWNGTALTVRGTVFATAGEIGGITIAANAVRAGQTAYNTGTGFHLGSDGRLSLGNSAGNRLTWDGTNLAITGTLNAGGVELGADVGPGTGHFGLSLSETTFDDMFMRRNDGVRFFRVNGTGNNSISFDSSSGNLNLNGNITARSFTTVGGRFTADSAGNVIADNVDIRRRIVLRSGALDPTDVVNGSYTYTFTDGKSSSTGTAFYPAGTVFRAVIQQIIYTDIYDANTQNASFNQPYYVAAHFDGSAFRSWSGTSGSTFDLHLSGTAASIRGYSNSGVFTNNFRVALVFEYSIRLVSGSFTSFRLPTASWTLFKL